MAAQTVTVRFDSGTEFWSTENPPMVGETIVRGSRRYLVTLVEADGDSVVVSVCEEERTRGAAAAASRAATTPAA
jgi:hypothetical protein